MPSQEPRNRRQPLRRKRAFEKNQITHHRLACVITIQPLVFTNRGGSGASAYDAYSIIRSSFVVVFQFRIVTLG